jgi:uncharacterized damage-inducible protein DinB
MPTLSHDPLDILLAYDAWATRLLLEHSRQLSHDQFHRRFEIGLGSLHDSFTHIIGAQRRWTDRIAHPPRPLRPPIAAIPGRPDIPHEGRGRTADELLQLHTQTAQEFQSLARDLRSKPDGLASTFSLDWPRAPEEGPGMKRYTFSRGCAITHVLNHGTHHRAQILNMLRHLKHPGLSDKLPELDLVDWQVAAESPPVLI